MKYSIREELESYLIDLINDNVLTDDNFEEWHQYAFNEDYYIIGYYNASKWLKKHCLSEFEAIDIVKEYEIYNFGEFTTEINSESITNMLIYIYGEDLINEFDGDTIEEFKEFLS
jgi:hypothetical protein